MIEDEEEATSVVQMKEDSKMTYSPLVMGLGSGYYSLNPVVFNSLLKEEDWIKNRDGLNSLYHRVDHAQGLNKVLDAQSDATNTAMNIEEDLVDGRAHFGVLQIQGIPVDEEPEEESEDESEEESEEVQVLPSLNHWEYRQCPLDQYDWNSTFGFPEILNNILYRYLGTSMMW